MAAARRGADQGSSGTWAAAPGAASVALLVAAGWSRIVDTHRYIRFGDFTLDVSAPELRRGGRPVRLTALHGNARFDGLVRRVPGETAS